MGGDEGVPVMLAGAARARRRYDEMRFLLVGDEAQISGALKSHPNLTRASEILHAPEVVGGDEKPSRGASPRQDDVDGSRDRRGEAGRCAAPRSPRAIPAR